MYSGGDIFSRTWVLVVLGYSVLKYDKYEKKSRICVLPRAMSGNTTREDKKTETQGQEEEARVVLKVPYVKGASEKLKKSLKKAAGVDIIFDGGVSVKQKLYAKLKPARDPME